MTDQVTTATFKMENGISAGADAATASMNKMADAADKVAAATATTEEKVAAAGRSIAAVRRQYDDIYDAERRYTDAKAKEAQAIAAVNIELAKGQITQVEAQRSIDGAAAATERAKLKLAGLRGEAQGLSPEMLATAAAAKVLGGAHDQAGISAGAQSFAMRQLGVQSMQAFSSIASGQPVITTLVQQGHQVADVMFSTGAGMGVLGTAAKAVGSALISPIGLMGLFAGGIAAAVYEATRFDAANRLIATSISSVGRAAELSASELTSYTHSLTAQGVGQGDANSIIAGLSRNSGLSSSAIGQVAGLAQDTAAALGTDAMSAATALGNAASGSYAAIKKLDDALNFLTVDENTQIRTMLEHGERTKAVEVAMASLATRVTGLHKDSLSPLSSTFEALHKSWDDFQTSIVNSSGFKALITTLKGVLDAANAVVNWTPSERPGEDLVDPTLPVGTRPPKTLNEQAQDWLKATDAIPRTANQKAEAMQAGGPITGGAAAAPFVPDAAANARNATSAELVKQRKLLDDVTEADRNQQAVLKQGLPGRAELQARLQAQSDVLKLGLSGKEADIYVETKAATARAQAGDQASQETAAILRQTQAALDLTAASIVGRTAMLQATAAAEAHDKAATEAGVSEDTLRDAILNRGAAQEAAKGAETVLNLNDQVEATKRLIAAQQQSPQAAYYASVDEKVRAATVSLMAQRDAAIDPGEKAVLTAVIALIRDKMTAQEALNVQAQGYKEITANDNEIERIKTEIGLLGDTEAHRSHELALLTERQKLLANGIDLESDYGKAALKSAGDVADARSALLQQRQAIQDLSNMATQAFDQVGQAISNAFVGGTGSAVNFGNVARSVLASVLQQVVKLAVINPILNSVFGASNTTLSGAYGALTGTAGTSNPIGTGQGGSGSSVSISDLLGLGKSAYSAFGNSSSTGVLGSFLNTGIGGYSTSEALALNTQTVAGIVSGGGEIPAGTAAVAGGAGTLGELLGGVGLGYGAGSIIGGLVAGNSPARQTNAQIGAGAGAAAGALAGTLIFPGVGSVVGGLIGGVLGGGGGGLIGPGAPHHGYSWAFQGSGNQLSVDNPMVDPTAQAEYDAENQQVAAINQYLAAQSLQVSGRVNVGGNNNIAWQKASLNAGFGDLRFGSTSDSMVDKALSGKSFASATDLQNAVTAVQNFEAALPGLLDPLNKNTTSAGTLQTALDGVNTTYTNAITQAQSYGRATDDLAAAQVTASQAIRDAADKSITTTLQGFTERALAATSGGGLAANLLAFDDQAQQQRDAFSSQLTALYGDAYKSTASYTQQTLTLEQTLSAERLKISQQYYDQGRQQVLSVVQSLTSYTRSLALSSASPLSAQDQYAYATNQFSTTSSAALNGDFTSLQGLQGSAQDFLTASRNLNGSGLQYARDYEKVTAALAAVAGASSDQLTASAMASIQRSTTDQLTQALGSLGSAVTGATLTNGDAVSSSIYASLNSFSTGLVAATNDNTEQLIANFRAIANSISASSQVALDEAALSRVQDYQTGRMLVGMDAIRAAVEAVTAEIRQQGSAPASYASAGGNGGSADIYGR